MENSSILIELIVISIGIAAILIVVGAYTIELFKWLKIKLRKH